MLGISALLAGVGWIWANDVLALNKPALTAVVEIDEGDTVGQVADKLEEQGLIEYKMVFKLFCSLTHTSGKAGEEGAKITPGTYELNTDMDYRALISSMGSSSANRMTTTVTIPEGMTEAQIFSLLEEKGVSTVEQLEEAAANYDFKFSFLKGVVPLGDPKRLEGYLFPDTYEFYMGEEPVSVLNKMILRFDEIFTDEMRQEVQNDGRTIRLVFPALTEERRRDLVKQVKKYGEEAKVAVRNIRRDAMDKFKAQKKKSEITEDDLKIIEKDLQKLTDDYIKEVERIADEKEKELMEI